MSEKMKTENLHLFYGEKEALKGIDISICERQIVSLIGPSGCGKSTVASLVMGKTVQQRAAVLQSAECRSRNLRRMHFTGR